MSQKESSVYSKDKVSEEKEKKDVVDLIETSNNNTTTDDETTTARIIITDNDDEEEEQRRRLQQEYSNNNENEDNNMGTTCCDDDEDIIPYEGCEPRYRMWLYDRVDGRVRDADKHPDLRCCTVPPCVKWLPTLFELNCVMEQLGRVGLRGIDQRKRKILMLIGLASNMVGLFLTIVACFATMEDFGVIRWTAFSIGRLYKGDENFAELFFGLKAGAIRTSTEEFVLPYDEFCDYVGTTTLPEPVLHIDECSGCDDVSNDLIQKLITTAVCYLPNIFTDILRMYPYYDVNCQKAFGMIINFSSIIVGYMLIRTYKHSCYATFNAGSFLNEENGEVFEYKWTGGPGLLRFWIATLLKLVDVFCHVLVPVPSIARDKRQQAEYETLPPIPISLSSVNRVREVWPGIDKLLEYW